MTSLSRDQFADHVLRGLRERGGQEFTFDEAAFAITSTGPAHLKHFLGFMYSELTAAASESEQRLVLERTIENTLRAKDFSTLPPPPAEAPAADGRLMPLLASRSFYERIVPQQARAAMRAHGSDDDEVADVKIDCAILGDHLAVGLAIDHDAQIQYVIDASSVGLTFSAAYASALSNLRQRRRKYFSLHSPGVYVAANGDYDAALLLLTDEVRALPLEGDPVAVVPCRGFLLITGSRDLAGLRTLATETRARIKGARPITSFAFRLRADDKWESYEPPGADEGSRLLRECARRELAQLYGEQRGDMESVYGGAVDEDGAFCACVMEIVGPEFRTLSTWTKDVRTLLPKTDYVALNDGRGTPVVVEWDRLHAICGARLQERSDMYPARWVTLGDPSSEQLTRLRAAAVSLRPSAPSASPRVASPSARATATARPTRREIPFVVWLVLAAVIAAGLARFVL